jgi:hypothetical protein
MDVSSRVLSSPWLISETTKLISVKFATGDLHVTPRMYPYFDVVVGLGWSYDPESYAGSSVAAGRVSHAGQVKGDYPGKKGYPGPPG